MIKSYLTSQIILESIENSQAHLTPLHEFSDPKLARFAEVLYGRNKRKITVCGGCLSEVERRPQLILIAVRKKSLPEFHLYELTFNDENAETPCGVRNLPLCDRKELNWKHLYLDTPPNQRTTLLIDPFDAQSVLFNLMIIMKPENKFSTLSDWIQDVGKEKFLKLLNLFQL